MNNKLIDLGQSLNTVKHNQKIYFYQKNLNVFFFCELRDTFVTCVSNRHHLCVFVEKNLEKMKISVQHKISRQWIYHMSQEQNVMTVR